MGRDLDDARAPRQAGRPDRFEARAYYRDFDGQTRLVAKRGKTRTEAANNLRTELKTRARRVGVGRLKPADRFSAGAELFMANLKVAIEDGVREPGTHDTYSYHLAKNVLPRIGEIRFYEATTPLVNKVLVAIKR